MTTLTQAPSSTAGAYRFEPKALAGMNEEEMQEFIASAMNHKDGMAEAYIDNGKLRVAIYSSHRNDGFFQKYHVSLRPGQWLVMDDTFPTIYTNSQMRMQRFEATLERWLGGKR